MSTPDQIALDEERRQNPQLGFSYSVEHTHDLSGLPSRKALMEAMNNAVVDPQLSGNFGLIFADLDGLKQINDTEGHNEGDKYLRYAAGALRDSTRPTDLVASVEPTLVTHLGGDEFAILVAGVSEPEALQSVKERLRQNLDEIGIPNSMGAKIHEQAETPSQLLAAADELMYADKIERKLAALSPEQRTGYITMGQLAIEHGLDVRDAAAIIPALRGDQR